MLEVNKNSLVFRLARHLCSSIPLVVVVIIITIIIIVVVVIIVVIIIIITSGVLEHKWRASQKLHFCQMIDFNFLHSSY